mmetsp:Transcript_26495/g.49458  ORF Transcript_26495/g.49458 Transcript_26495/m.49458 type:complete len:135 (+) Transcript_26495:215-619(+)|eukprot:CAMPEP_0178888160 /NCGR_PEP_ID=MMETSP0747-20121128/17020_1 /TAXON_ID=913974 /ORGANISM="Nitzschia punctata, Strain CCMP561" /LENGTH=134 /DNA_ID=CAMNT_0020557445 /DNA_START=136 /DNA_END=540 /DNA_ORIENTATION=-
MNTGKEDLSVNKQDKTAIDDVERRLKTASKALHSERTKTDELLTKIEKREERYRRGFSDLKRPCMEMASGISSDTDKGKLEALVGTQTFDVSTESDLFPRRLFPTRSNSSNESSSGSKNQKEFIRRVTDLKEEK